MPNKVSESAKLAATATASNPKAILGKDDFLKLLLTELQYQDPTAPMDTEKILSQTSQLASLEAQENTNKALEALTKSFANEKNFSAVSAIGKMARLENSVQLKTLKDGSSAPVNFNLNFDEAIKGGDIKIYNEQGAIVKSIPLEEDRAGKHSFNWDGKDNGGNNVKAGKYFIKGTYQNEDGLTLDAKTGAHKIESIKFEDDKTFVKLNGSYIDFAQVSEIYDAAKTNKPQATQQNNNTQNTQQVATKG
jgi:flagellar basal-body rod modification protein FlgD